MFNGPTHCRIHTVFELPTTYIGLWRESVNTNWTIIAIAPRRIAGEKVWLLQNSVEKHTKQQLTMGKILQVLSVAGALSALIRRWFVTKRYSRDEDDGEEDAFAGCTWRGMTTTQTVGRRTKCPDVHVVSSYIAHVLIRRGIYLRAAFISLSASNCAAFIQGRRLFAEIRYSLTYS